MVINMERNYKIMLILRKIIENETYVWIMVIGIMSILYCVFKNPDGIKISPIIPMTNI